MMNVPQICWDEGLGQDEELLIAERIMAELMLPLSKQYPDSHTLFFIVPTPTPYKAADAAFVAAATTAGASPRTFRELIFRGGGRFYATAEESMFKALLPPAFHLGPAELTLIAAHCRFDFLAPTNEIADYVLAVLQDRATARRRDFVGMHFDSGDLVEIFGSVS